MPLQIAENDYLRLFLAYRILLGVALLLVFYGTERSTLGSHSPVVFTAALHSYLGLGLIGLVANLRGNLDIEKQAQLAVFIDIAAITILMHASGGVQSGLGMLIAVSIALSSLSLLGHTALLFAAIASLAVLTERIFSQITAGFPDTAYMQAGLLGALYFALAWLAHRLGSRASANAALADQRSSDLANLARLNDFVIQHMRAGILVVDADGVVETMNEAAWVLLGMPVAMRHHPLQEASPRLAAQYHLWAQDATAERPDFRAGDGGRDLRASFSRIGGKDSLATLIVLEDRAQLTAEVQQLKLASLGRLTAGIAHEIRNPLGAISHAAQLLDESSELPDADRRMIEIINRHSHRVNDVVENILRLSRQDVPRLESLKLADWVERASTSLRLAHDLNEEQLFSEVSPDNTMVLVDPGQLQQVIDILVDNAVCHFDRDAQKLRIRLAGGISPGAGPFIEMRDNGPGISGDNAEHLFEPFFTTRHEGTGLGLYIARQLCEANQIRIEHLSPPTGGSCFRLSFPHPNRPPAL